MIGVLGINRWFAQLLRSSENEHFEDRAALDSRSISHGGMVGGWWGGRKVTDCPGIGTPPPAREHSAPVWSTQLILQSFLALDERNSHGWRHKYHTVGGTTATRLVLVAAEQTQVTWVTSLSSDVKLRGQLSVDQQSPNWMCGIRQTLENIIIIQLFCFEVSQSLAFLFQRFA